MPNDSDKTKTMRVHIEDYEWLREQEEELIGVESGTPMRILFTALRSDYQGEGGRER